MNANKKNFFFELENIVDHLPAGEIPKVLLHACCAPCSSRVLEYLSDYFAVYLLYYNPNISPEEEYEKRKRELERLIGEMPLKNEVTLVPCAYDPAPFIEAATGLEEVPEGGARCHACYRLRLEEAAQKAVEIGADYFTTTLSVSPHKNAEVLNSIGEEIGEIYKIRHLPGDFKKKEGYKRSIELSQKYGLYRQNYCGCMYSKKQRERERGGGT